MPSMRPSLGEKNKGNQGRGQVGGASILAVDPNPPPPRPRPQKWHMPGCGKILQPPPLLQRASPSAMQERRRCPGPPALRQGARGRGAEPTMPQVSDLRPLSSPSVLRPRGRGSGFPFCPVRLGFFCFLFFFSPESGQLSNLNLKF